MPKRMLLESKGKVYREFFKKKINIKFGACWIWGPEEEDTQYPQRIIRRC
jgi:hypothetical protein